MRPRLSTFKKSGFILKSMSSQNVSRFWPHIRRLVCLSSYHITDATQFLTLFTSDQVSLLQLSKSWNKRGKEQEDSSILAYQYWPEHLHKSPVSLYAWWPAYCVFIDTCCVFLCCRHLDYCYVHVYAHSYVKCSVKDLARKVSTQWGTLAQLHIRTSICTAHLSLKHQRMD